VGFSQAPSPSGVRRSPDTRRAWGLGKSHCQITHQPSQPGKISLRRSSSRKPCFGYRGTQERENRREGFQRKPDACFLYQRGECSQGLVHSGAIAEEWIGAQRRPLTAEGRQPLKTTRVRKSEMQQPHLITYLDIAEVWTVTGTAACNQFLSKYTS
jgi:hypothetical protein